MTKQLKDFKIIGRYYLTAL